MSAPARVAARVRRGLDLDWCRPERVLGARPGSLVLLLDSARGPLVAKVGSPPAAAREVAARALVGPPSGPLALPRLLLRDAGLLVLEHCPGVPLDERIRAGDVAAVHRAGVALARLQEIDPGGDPAGLRQQATDLLRPGPAEWAAHSSLGDRASRLLETLVAAEPVAVPGRPVHRDLHTRQVLDDGPRTWVLDWEHAAVGDPALDVGNLCGHLRARLAQAVAEPAVAAFRAGYAGGDRDAALTRTGRYEAFTSLRLACKAARAGRTAATEVDRLLTMSERMAAREVGHVLVG